MCGIAGMVRFSGLRPEESAIGAVMADCLHHRGPDGTGHHADACASLGHTRLSIIDLEGGHQPLSNEDGTIWVTFNGEIYNHGRLAQDLKSRGHRFRTRCDTEVLVHLYEEYEDSFVDHLNGMFAMAVWDTRRRRLLLVRDRLGIKPLYWHSDGDRVLFGSELKAILAAGGVPRSVDPCALAEYLTFGHVPAPMTIFEGIRKLEPGFMAICTASGASLRRYWDIPFACEGDDRDAEQPREVDGQAMERETRDWTDRFIEVLDDAVSLRLIADVPVGAFLSGGVDSSTVVATMCRLSGSPVVTQTIGFNEQGYDERAAARTVAQQLGTEHHEVLIQPDAVSVAQQLAVHFDEPFADSSAVPVLYLSQAARRRVKVALAGDGADEMLAGYRRYRFDVAESALRACCPRWLRRSTAGVAGWLYPKADWLPRPLRAKATLQNLAHDDATAHLRSVAIRAGALPRYILNPSVSATIDGYDPFTRGRELFARCPSRHLLNRLLYTDMKTLMVDDILTKVDRMSMAVGLEVREPLLDYRIVELAAAMPVRMKLAGRTGKYVLRQALARRMGPVPGSPADRPKHGFDVPLDAWFRGPLRSLAFDALTSADTHCRQWIIPDAVNCLLREHQTGVRANGSILWALLSLELWARAFVPAIAGQRPAMSGTTGQRWNESARCGVNV